MVAVTADLLTYYRPLSPSALTELGVVKFVAMVTATKCMYTWPSDLSAVVTEGSYCVYCLAIVEGGVPWDFPPQAPAPSPQAVLAPDNFTTYLPVF